MTAIDQLKSFNAQLMQGIELLEQLKQMLNAERKALESRALSEVQTLTERKQAVINQYLELNQQRTELLQAMGFEASGTGVQTLIEAAPPEARPTLTKNWKKLESQLESIQSLNKINSQISGRSLKNIEQLLSIMSGRHGKNRIYTPKGTAGHYRAQSRIGKA